MELSQTMSGCTANWPKELQRDLEKAWKVHKEELAAVHTHGSMPKDVAARQPCNVTYKNMVGRVTNTMDTMENLSSSSTCMQIGVTSKRKWQERRNGKRS